MLSPLAIQVVVASLLASLTYYIVSAIYLCFLGHLSHIPGPIWTNFTNIPEVYHAFADDRAFWVHKLHEKYGSAVRVSPNSISVTGADAIKKIYGLGSKPYDKWSGYTQGLRLLGPGIDSLAGLNESSANARRRKIFSSRFTRQSLFTSSERIENCINRYGLGVEVERTRDALGVVDILRAMRSATLDVVTEVAYGGSWKGRGMNLGQALGDVIISQLLRSVLPPLHALFLRIPLKSLDWVRTGPQILRISDESIEHYLLAHQSADEKPQEPLADILFSPNPETGVPLSRPVQNLEVFTLLLAGVDTTADTAALTAWEIAKHPEVAAKLQKELDAIFPDVSVDSVLSLKDVEKATWLTACLKEGMRIHPAVPGPMPRVVPPGGAELCNYVIPQNVLTFIQPYTSHRDPLIYPDPEAFKPQRWLDETQDMRTYFLGFSSGPRLCLGYSLAWMELRLMIAFLFRNYNISPAPGVKMVLGDRFTLHPTSGKCPLVLERR